MDLRKAEGYKLKLSLTYKDFPDLGKRHQLFYLHQESLPLSLAIIEMGYACKN